MGPVEHRQHEQNAVQKVTPIIPTLSETPRDQQVCACPGRRVQPTRSMRKRARRRERRAVANHWNSKCVDPILVGAESIFRRFIYKGQPPCAWVEASGLAVQAPLFAARRFANHFEQQGSGHEFITLEVTQLPVTPCGLSHSGRRLFDQPNAGGSSESSEAWAFDVLRMILGARLVATEMELRYLSDDFPLLCGTQGRTDFAVELPQGSEVVGVSVTRAFAFHRSFLAEDARKLLRRKLTRILTSTLGCVGPLRWARQILFIWTRSALDAQVLRAVFDEDDEIASTLKADALVIVAVCPVGHLYRKHGL